jgi:hypothetical protein
VAAFIARPRDAILPLRNGDRSASVITFRKRGERGGRHQERLALESCHTVFFAVFHAPQYMGPCRMRVIDDDAVACGGKSGGRRRQ